MKALSVVAALVLFSIGVAFAKPATTHVVPGEPSLGRGRPSDSVSRPSDPVSSPGDSVSSDQASTASCTIQAGNSESKALYEKLKVKEVSQSPFEDAKMKSLPEANIVCYKYWNGEYGCFIGTSNLGIGIQDPPGQERGRPAKSF